MNIFTIKAYGLQELARLYFPNCSPSSASFQLKRWMKDKILYKKLEDAHYYNGQKILTPRQVEVIIKHIGEPEKSLEVD